MNLKKLRGKIDTIDAKLVALLNERAKISKSIGQEKLKNNKSIYSPDREKMVLQKIQALNKGPMSAEALEEIYREVMSCSLSLEKPLNIATLGTIGSFSYIAAKKKFGSQVNYISCKNIPEVFEKVELGECDYGFVPIENSVEGAVTDTFDLLADSELKVCSQSMMAISHNLLARIKNKDKINYVYSNPQVFGQCRNWLNKNLRNAEQVWVPSTTIAAEKATKEKNAAAIASLQVAEIYRLHVLERNIQDIAHNTTRFWVIAKEDASPTGHDRTSILFSIKDKVGALHAMLTPFYKYRINLTKIESRPSKKKAWDYYFFVDFEGHRLDKHVKKALDQLEHMCKYLKILGSYPA